MIVYQSNKAEFLRHALVEDIDLVIGRQFRSALGHGVASGEVRAWRHSLLEMARVLSDSEIPEDAGIAIALRLSRHARGGLERIAEVLDALQLLALHPLIGRPASGGQCEVVVAALRGQREAGFGEG